MKSIELKHNWLAVRRDYFDGAGSLRDLSARYGIPRRTLERRASREGWRRERTGLGGIVTAKAAEVAAEHGRQLGTSAAEFVERSKHETRAWQDRIEALAAKGELTPDALQKLVSSWRSVLSSGREAFELDSQGKQTVIFGVDMLSDRRLEPCLNQIEVEVVSEPKSESSTGG